MIMCVCVVELDIYYTFLTTYLIRHMYRILEKIFCCYHHRDGCNTHTRIVYSVVQENMADDFALFDVDGKGHITPSDLDAVRRSRQHEYIYIFVDLSESRAFSNV